MVASIRDWKVFKNPIGSPFTPSPVPTFSAGDDLYIIGFWDVTIVGAAPADAGFSLVESQNYGNDGQGIAIWRKPSASGSETWAMTSTNNNDCMGFLVAVRDGSGGALTFTNKATSNVEAQSPNLTGASGTAATGDLVIYAGGVDGESANQQFTFDSYLGSLTEVGDDTNNNWSNGCFAQIANASGAIGTVGCTATRSSGSTGDCRGWAQIVISIPSASTTGPTIDTNPSNAHVAVGQTATFTVAATATGGGALTYQWKLGGVNVSSGSGGTTATYTTAALTLSDDGNQYTCAVTETGGSNDGTSTSTAATLRVGIIYLGSGGPAYSAAAGATVAATYPTVTGGIQAGDQLVCFVAYKPPTASPNTGTVTTPTTGGTWNRPAERTAANDGNTGGYTTTIGADTGNVNGFSFDLLASGGETGSFNISLGGSGTGSVAWAVMLAFRKPPGTAWSSVVGSTGKRTQNTTPSAGVVSESMAADPGVTAGDYIAFMMGVPTDQNGGVTWSGEAITQTGVTYETAVETDEPFTGNGNDIGGFIAITRALTGTGSAAPVVGATKNSTTTNARGPILFLRLRTVGLSMLALMPWQRRNRNPAYFNM